MKNIRLTTIADKTVLLNWENVTFVKATSNHFGDSYSEIHCGEQIIDVKETIEEIESTLGAHQATVEELLEEEASQHYSKSDSGTVTERLR